MKISDPKGRSHSHHIKVVPMFNIKTIGKQKNVKNISGNSLNQAELQK
jgi:hypothetical protein